MHGNFAKASQELRQREGGKQARSIGKDALTTTITEAKKRELTAAASAARLRLESAEARTGSDSGLEMEIAPGRVVL